MMICMKMKLVVICDIATLTTVPHLLLIPGHLSHVVTIVTNVTLAHVTCDSWDPTSSPVSHNAAIW